MILDFWAYPTETLYNMLSERERDYETHLLQEPPKNAQEYRRWQLLSHACQEDIRRIRNAIEEKSKRAD